MSEVEREGNEFDEEECRRYALSYIKETRSKINEHRAYCDCSEMASIEKDWHSCAAYAEGIEQIKNSIYLEKSNPARRDLRKLIRLSEDLNKKYNSFISEQAREKVKAEAEPVEEKIIQLRGELKQSDSDLAILERRLKGKTMHFLDKIHDLEIAFDDLVCKHRLDKEPFSNIEEAKYDDRFTYVLLGIMAFIFFIISCTVHMASE